MVVADIVRRLRDYEIVGFVDDLDPSRRGTEFCGVPVLGGGEQLSETWKRGVRHLLVAVGDNQARLRLAERARSEGFEFATAVHPSAVVAADVTVGAGTVIAAGVAVNPGTRIGQNAIINTGAIVDHECTIEDGAHIGPGARLGGSVHVGRGAWIGIGATLIDRILVGAAAMVGAGALVLDNVPGGTLAYGVPAQPVRKFVGARGSSAR